MNTRLKYLIFVGLISTFSVLTSCKEDDETPSSPIVGTWNYSSADIVLMVNGQSFTSFLVENLDYTQAEAAAVEAFFKTSILGEADFQGLSITFNADGTYSVKDNGIEEDSGTWELRNNNTLLVLSSEDGPQELDVKTLTNNNLSISFTEEEMEDITEDGVDETIGVTFTLNLTK